MEEGSKGWGVRNSPTILVEDFYHFELGKEEGVPSELLVLGLEEEGACLHLAFDFFFSLRRGKGLSPRRFQQARGNKGSEIGLRD